MLGGSGGCPPYVLGLHLSMGYGDPRPLLSGTRGPKPPLTRLTAITRRLMASLRQPLEGQGNRRELQVLQVLQLVGPELQKLLTKVRSFCNSPTKTETHHPAEENRTVPRLAGEG